MKDDERLVDFIYADHEKVASLIAQSSGVGALVGTEQHGQKGRTEKQDAGIRLGRSGVGRQDDRSWQKAVRETYDPLWLNSSTFVRKEFAKSRITPKAEFKLGQLVCLQGKLIALDLHFVKDLMNVEAMADFIAQGSKDAEDKNKGKPRQQRINKKSDEYMNAQVVQEYVKGMPLGVQFVLVDDENGFWFNIKREYLTMNQADIPLKYPLKISGIWNVCGVIDALPHDQIAFEEGEVAKVGAHFPEFARKMVQLLGMSGLQFGRSPSSFGITPLAVFRFIS